MGSHSKAVARVAQRLLGTAFHDVVRPPLGHGLTSVDVYVTSPCNRRCTYCFLPSEFFASGARMSLDAFSGVVTWCLRHGVGEITLLGGEPSLHPSFAEMVAAASGQGLDVRVVTNGARRFRRLMEDGVVGPDNLSRVAVSLDTLDENVQDGLRGPGAWRGAMDTVRLARPAGCPVRHQCHWRAIGAGRPGCADPLRGRGGLPPGQRALAVEPSAWAGELAAEQIPDPMEWLDLVTVISKRAETRPDLFVEIERGFLAEGEPLDGNAPCLFSPICRYFPTVGPIAAGCWSTKWAWRRWPRDQLLLTRPGSGEDLLEATMSPACSSCPAMSSRRQASLYLRQGQLGPLGLIPHFPGRIHIF